MVAGLGRLLDTLPRMRFHDDDLDFLRSTGVVDETTARWLSSYRFSGSIRAYAEGEAYFPGSPVLVVQGGFAECLVLETLILSILNHDSAVATAAARMICAAGERPCIEMGSRRTHEEAAVAAARAAYVAGFAATSNLAAGRRWGIPTTGTAAHAFTLAHDDEPAAFRAQVAALGRSTTLLVDTYDVERGIRNAVAAAGPDLGAIRLDSGDLLSLAAPRAPAARRARRHPDANRRHQRPRRELDRQAGRRAGRRFRRGHRGGHRQRGADGRIRLQARRAQVRRRLATGREAFGGQGVDGRPEDTGPRPPRRGGDDRAGLGRSPTRAGDEGERLLLGHVVDRGEVVRPSSLEESRAHCRRSVAELPPEAMKLSPGEPAIETRYEEVPG